MGIFDGYLVCSDCDWTLTNSDRVITKENSDAIRFFQENGGLFTVATGRYPHYIQEYAGQFEPSTYVVGCNGTVLYDLKKDEAVFSMPLKGENFTLLEYVFREIPSIIEVCATGDTGELFRYSNTPGIWKDLYGKTSEEVPLVTDPEQIRELLESTTGPINRFLFIQQEADIRSNLKKLNQQFGSAYKFTQSWGMGLEAQDPASGKGEMIEKLRDYLPFVHTSVSIGDNDNDISMLEMCDLSFAVANAQDFVKEKADRVTVSCEESAVAAVIDYLYKSNKMVDK